MRALAIIVAIFIVGCIQTPWYSKSSEEVVITMDEFSFNSSRTQFEKGVGYTFIIKNAGKIPHEFAIAPRGVRDHAKMLLHITAEKFPPGAQVRRRFTFTQEADLEFACHIMGHYENGMVLPIETD